MARVVELAEIERALAGIDLIGEIETGFVAFSEGKVMVPPVGELLFEDPPGELHIKYGAIRDDDVFVVKMATGFYRNPTLGLPPFNGMNVVFSARTGAPLMVLLDRGHLTNVRTAVAGAIAAKHLAPRSLSAIGICGSGVQARLQAEYLKSVTSCRDVVLWARDPGKVEACAADLGRSGFRVRTAATPAAVAASANLIVTTTAAHTAYLSAGDVRPGTHITAIGSDTPEKTELEPLILGKADIVAADSAAQCLIRGEIRHAIAAGVLDPGRVVELGVIISDPSRGRRDDAEITVADLTGVAFQDIQISKAVCARLERAPGRGASRVDD
jgi:ornithine cyclodeaminase/alanine dehydrogenase-like protein (mu-crystallin family)